ncbi:MAG: DNA-3-methyladenine glycosylase I [Spirochaetaceae bacterium]|nr:DNA-3-methyladenine glycosylase I [Spirochaetaceae bacterium]
MKSLIEGHDGLVRCAWCGDDELYKAYHDKEWGRPAWDDGIQFEFMVLESAQAGLSWITILRKREVYRSAYAGFNPHIVADWTDSDVSRLLDNPLIVRNRKKIEASIGNAKAFLKVSAEYGRFADWILDLMGGRPLVNHWRQMDEIPARTALSEKISDEMKTRGFRFFGPVIVYSHLQATGFIDDHLIGCWRHTPKG